MVEDRVIPLHAAQASGFALEPCGAFGADRLAGRPVAPRRFNVADMIPFGTVTTLDGDGGAGKSSLALQLSTATVLGKPWLGQDVLKGRALYVAAEDDTDELHRRIAGLLVHYDADYPDLAGHKLWPRADQDAALAVTDDGGRNIASTPLWTELQAMVADFRPVLLVLDSRADVFAGLENDRAQVRAFIAMLRQLAMRHSLGVLLLAHPSLAGMANGSGSSGSTAWNNSVRSRLYLSRPSGAGSDPDLRTLEVKKANYAASGSQLVIRRRLTGAYEVEGDAGANLDACAAHARVDRLFLDLLDQYASQGRSVGDQPGATYAPTLFARDPAAGGTMKHGFLAAMNRLFRSGDIKVECVGPPSKQRRRLIRAARDTSG